MTSLEQVKEFHEKFNCPIHDKPYIKNKKLNELRIRLLSEELLELEVALMMGIETEVLDALLDLQVVLDGAFLALGFWKVKDEAFMEVHSSNMSKLGEDGKPIYREDRKVLKGPNYSPPKLYKFIDKLMKGGDLDAKSV